MTLPVTLASGSQIRRQILDGAGVIYDVEVSRLDEAAIKSAMLAENARPRDIADALAEAKAMKVSRDRPGLIIGADQVMVMDGTLYDKPKDLVQARARLLSMRGKPHYLMGAVVVCENGQAVWRHISKTTLYVRDFSENFLDEYLAAEGESILSAVGGYKFEGRGAQLFTKVEGDFFSILGLSLLPLLDYLRLRGVMTL
jgi:septum formation protein